MVVILHKKENNKPVLISETNLIFASPVDSGKGSKVKLSGMQSTFEVNESVEKIMAMINDTKK